MFEGTEDDVDEETNNKDRNTAQSENDLNKGVDNEDGVLSAEDTGNAEGTIVDEDRFEDTGNAEELLSVRIVKNLQAKQVVLGEKLQEKIVFPLKSREKIL